MMIKRIIAIGMIVIMGALSITGCSETKGFLGGKKAEVEKVTSYDVNIPTERIRSLNPVISKDEDTYYISKLIYDGLFQLDDNLNPVPVLAQGYEYGDQGTSLTIHLKDGIQWQDGESFTARDVKFSIESYMAQTASVYYSYVSNIKSVRAVDNNTVDIQFKDPKNVDIDNFTFPIVAEHQFKSKSMQLNENFIPIGTGTYKVESYDNFSKLILVPNDRYEHGTIAKNKLIFQVMQSKKDAVNLVDIGAISLLFSKQVDRDAIYANKGINKVKSFPSNEVEFIGFNFKKKPFDDRRVRQAIAHVVELDNIIETGYYKSGMKNDNIYFPNYLGVESKKNIYSFDTDKAEKLLEQAGYIDRDGDGLVENSDNEKLTVNILVNSNNQSRMVAAQSIKKGLEKLPIESNIVSKEWDAYNSAIGSSEYDIYVGGYQLKDTYDLRFLLHSGYANPIGYNNPELDTLLDKMESGISLEEKKDTYKKVKTILEKEMPYYCLLYKTYGVISPKSFQGKLSPMFNHFYRGSEEWSNVFEKQTTDDK